MPQKTVRVPNISCGHCVRTIENELGEVAGVVKVNADQASKLVGVEWNEPPADWQALRSKLVEINYAPEEA